MRLQVVEAPSEDTWKLSARGELLVLLIELLQIVRHEVAAAVMIGCMGGVIWPCCSIWG